MIEVLDTWVGLVYVVRHDSKEENGEMTKKDEPIAGTTLPEIIDQIALIQRTLAENMGELTPELESSFNNLDLARKDKLDAYQMVREQMATQAEYWKDKAEQYKKLSKGCMKVKDRLGENLKFAMRQLGVKEIEGHDTRFILSKAKSRLIIDEDRLPGTYLMEQVDWVPDKERIRKHLEVTGRTIQGARLEESFALRANPNTTRRRKKDGRDDIGKPKRLGKAGDGAGEGSV